jgi:acetyl-CoA decarbonylase/synthase, CODH/ACS complex subunit beta
MSMQRQAVEQILALLPERAWDFTGSQYPAPVRATFLGDGSLDIAGLCTELLAKQAGDAKDLLRPLLLAAEVVEAAQDDSPQFFIADRAVQSFVFMGSKWRAGWALVLGGADQGELIGRLQERSFMVFTDQAGIPDTAYIGGRDTSPIYFLQLMVRYGLIWGRIAPGDDHEMGHFLEKDMPGLIVVCADLPPLKYLVTLGLMKLGAPAIVPGSFPFPYGYRLVADTIPDILERIGHLPNLRQRYYLDEVISLPAPCNPALVHEQFPVGRRFGGEAGSFFCVRPGPADGERLRVSGEPAGALGIDVTIAADRLGDDVAMSVERAALRGLNTLPGVHAYEQNDLFCMDLAAGVDVDPAQLADVICAAIRLEYPRLRDIAIAVIFDARVLAGQAAGVRAYKAQRRADLATMTEHNTEEFCACTECRPFSLVHTCILTPGRMPMCGSRTYSSVKAAAYFGSDQVPWKRLSEKDLPMRSVFAKGELLDPERGEYAGCNRIYSELTRGQLRRVYLHSVRDYPLTSCGCFQALAFWLPEVAGLGIMARHSAATTPDGQTWEMLANRAGGKQTPGTVGVSHQYMHAPNFLKGDGGMANVVWVDSGLYGKIARLFAPGQRVATEREVSTTAQLLAWLGR